MPRKKSLKLAAAEFRGHADAIETFLRLVSPGQTPAHVEWLHNYAVIRLYKVFESLMQAMLVGAINNDSSTLEATTGIKFPRHLSKPVCEYIVTGGGYFDFKGRDGLIKTMKELLPNTHYLIVTVSDRQFSDALDQLSALRNYAAHGSSQSKAAALKSIKSSNLASSGSWLKRQGRFGRIVNRLKALATELERLAPY